MTDISPELVNALADIHQLRLQRDHARDLAMSYASPHVADLLSERWSRPIPLNVTTKNPTPDWVEYPDFSIHQGDD